MANYNLLKRYFQFRGLDLNSSDLERSMIHSPNTFNADFIKEGGIKKREGVKICARGYGDYGSAKFQSTSYFGITADELIFFGGPSPSVYRMKKSFFNISASQDDSNFRVYYNNSTDKIVVQLTADGSVVSTNSYDQDSTTDYITTLATTINGLTDFSVSLSPTASIPVTNLDYCDVDLSDGDVYQVYYYYFEEIPYELYSSFRPITTSVQQHSSTILNGKLYFSGYAQELWKYDGFSVFRAGSNSLEVYEATNQYIASGVTGSVETYLGDSSFSSTNRPTGVEYKFRLKTIDATGNVSESPFFDMEITGSDAAGTASMAYSAARDLVHPKYGSAKINGSTTGLIFTVDSGNTLIVGDICCVYDAAQGMVVYREVTASSDTSLSISTTALPFSVGFSGANVGKVDSGGSITVNDNAHVSAGVTLDIFRTKSGDATFYQFERYPVTNLVTQYQFIDDFADSYLGPAELIPAVAKGLPPRASIVTSYNSNLVLGDLLDVTEAVQYSNATDHESFNAANQFILDSEVKGLGQSGEIFMAASNNSIYAVSGDLNSFAFRVDKIADHIGCVSANSVAELDEGILIFLSEKGPYMFSSGRGLTPLGPASNDNVPRISSYFNAYYRNRPTTSGPNFNNAVAGVWKLEKKYYLHIPSKDSSSDGDLFVYDYGKDAWLRWSNIDASGGIQEYDDSIFFCQDSFLRKQQRSPSIYAYCDHNQAIDFNYDFQWETMGESSVFKKFLRLNLFSTNSRINSAQIVGIKTYKDYDDTNLRDNTSMTFAGEANKKIKLKSDKMKSMKLSLYDDSTLSGYNNPIEISGYEIEAVAPYQLRIKQ